MAKRVLSAVLPFDVLEVSCSIRIRASSTRTMTEWVTWRERGGWRSQRASLTMTALGEQRNDE
jgi:hypothetical protein